MLIMPSGVAGVVLSFSSSSFARATIAPNPARPTNQGSHTKPLSDVAPTQ